ncbi:MAG: GatB/YqeY domain-containing protein [Gemmatimonadota bacterium]
MSEAVKARLREDLKSALKAGESARVGTLRMILSELRNEEIEKGRELTEDEFLALVSSGVKSRRESAEHFRGAGRGELVAQEEAEIAVLRGYLPAQLGDAELDALVLQAVAETGASSPREMGKVMGWLMPRVRGRADGAEVSRRVKEKLGG